MASGKATTTGDGPENNGGGPQIHKAIHAMLAEVGAIEKKRKVADNAGGWSFRGIDDVFTAVHPLLAKHGVYPTSRIDNMLRDERQTTRGGMLMYTVLTMTYRFWATDGSYVETTVIGEAMDSGDKSANKAMSVAYKYAIFQMLAIPVVALDPDEDVHEVRSKDAENRPVPKKQEMRQPANTRPLDIKAVSKRIQDVEPSIEAFKAIAKEINQAGVNSLVPAHEAAKLRAQVIRRLVEFAPTTALAWIEGYEPRGMISRDDFTELKARADQLIAEDVNGQARGDDE